MRIGTVVAVFCAGLLAVVSALWWRRAHPVAGPKIIARTTEVPTPAASRVGRPPYSVRISNSTVIDGAITQNIPKGHRAFSVVTHYPAFTGPAKDYVEGLLPASDAGDASATWRIWSRIHACRPAINEVDPGEVAIYTGMGLGEQHLQSILDLQHDCGSLIAEPALWKRAWLARAAEQGSLEARLMYAKSPEEALGADFDALAHPDEVMAYRSRAMAYLENAAGNGSLDALISLSTAYANGVLVPADPATSHAYARVVMRVDPRLDMGVEASGSELPEAELRRARALESRIYRECCD